MNLILKKAALDDIKLAIELQNKAFEQDYIRYGCCPSYNRSIDEMKNIVLNYYDFIILLDAVPVGNLIAKRRDYGECHLNSLGIIPAYQNKGIGIASMRQFEEYFSDCSLFSLDTPKDKKYNICFYEKCGYKIIGEDNSSGITCILFEKKNK